MVNEEEEEEHCGEKVVNRKEISVEENVLRSSFGHLSGQVCHDPFESFLNTFICKEIREANCVLFRAFFLLQQVAVLSMQQLHSSSSSSLSEPALISV